MQGWITANTIVKFWRIPGTCMKHLESEMKNFTYNFFMQSSITYSSSEQLIYVTGFAKRGLIRAITNI